MNEELSIWSLFIEASLLVQMVMFLLLIASIVSWTIIIEKWRTLKEAREDTTTFENRFWSGIDLVELYKQVERISRVLRRSLRPVLVSMPA